jgi:dipeptidyl-peptidase 4
MLIARVHATLSISLLFSLAAFSQKKDFTDEQLLKNKLPAITVPLPQFGGWEQDGNFLVKKRIHPDSPLVTYMINPKTGAESLWQDKNTGQLKQESKVVSKNDDLYLMQGSSGELRLTNDADKEVNPVVSPDRNYVAFTKKNDLYVIDLNTKNEKRITTDGSDLILNGYASWVYMEEILGRATQYKAFWWSPDSKHIAFFRSDDTQVPEFIITDAPGERGVVEKTRYPKVSDKNPEVRVGVFNVLTSNTTWADFNQKDDQYFGMPYWKPGTSELLLQWMPRTQDKLVIYKIDPTTGKKTEFYSESQKTWVEFDESGERMNFLKNGKGLLLTSDKTGFNHLYYHNMDGKLINPVTTGRYSVIDLIKVDEKNNVVYFTARGRENTARVDLYSIKLNGKDLKRLTFGDYNHAIQASPTNDYFITAYSNASTPTKMTLIDKNGKILKDLADSKGPAFNEYNIAKAELIRVKSEDGKYDLPANVTWPLNMVEGKKYPVLISIYGGPGRQDAHDRWNFNANQQWYAKEGLIQIAIDHRGSAHFGKEGTNYMHRNLGYWEMKDYASVIKHLINIGVADPKKICITGFSYGGYLAAYAVTYGADLFTHAMAGGSVIDWTLYDTHYTERLMDTPAENPEGYKSSSVLTHADKYKGKLLLVHGMIDDNVHMQNTIQFASKLQDLKKDFDLMLYSGGRHGWGGNKGAHFANLKTRFIYEHLLEKEVPRDLLK